VRFCPIPLQIGTPFCNAWAIADHVAGVIKYTCDANSCAVASWRRKKTEIREKRKRIQRSTKSEQRGEKTEERIENREEIRENIEKVIDKQNKKK